MNLKKNCLAVFLVLQLLVVLPSLAQTAESASTPHFTQLVKYLTLGTGSMSGTYFPLGNAFANIWTLYSKNISVMAHSTQGSIDNLNLMRRRELNLAIAQSDIVVSAIRGSGAFSGRALPDLKVVMALYPEVIQVVVMADSDIVNVGQLRGRRVLVGAPGSGNSKTAFELLEVCGIGAEDFEPVYLSYDEAIQAMERREYDAAFIIAGIPTTMISELQKRRPVRIVPFTQSEIESLTGGLPYLSALSLPAATYSGLDAEVKTVALMAMLVAEPGLSDDLVYRLCAGIYDNLGYLGKVHERARDISLENFMLGVSADYVHPGAARFYAERRR